MGIFDGLIYQRVNIIAHMSHQTIDRVPTIDRKVHKISNIELDDNVRIVLLLENVQFNGGRNNEKVLLSTAFLLEFAFTTLSPVAHANGRTDQLLSPVTGRYYHK
jgi:hypothetical protein